MQIFSVNELIEPSFGELIVMWLPLPPPPPPTYNYAITPLWRRFCTSIDHMLPDEWSENGMPLCCTHEFALSTSRRLAVSHFGSYNHESISDAGAEILLLTEIQDTAPEPPPPPPKVEMQLFSDVPIANFAGVSLTLLTSCHFQYGECINAFFVIRSYQGSGWSFDQLMLSGLT